MSEYFEFQAAQKSSQSFNTNYSASSETSANNKTTTINNITEQQTEQNALTELKRLIGASLDYALKDKSCLNDDEFLKSFLYARKYHTANAFELILNYHQYKHKYKELLSNLNIFDNRIQLALKDGFPHILKNRDRRGRKIIVILASNWNCDNYSLEVIYRSLLLTLDKLIDNKQNQVTGFVMIIDWNNFTFKQTSNLNLKTLNIIIEGLQDSYPAIFKAIHLLGQPWHVEMIINLSKLSLNGRNRERIHNHGKNNLSTLHEYFPKDVLPSELGGEGPCLNPLDWYHKLLECSQINQPTRTYKITDNIVYTKLSNS